MRLACLLLVLVSLAPGQDPAAEHELTLLKELRFLGELGLATEVLERFSEHVAGAGVLARHGEAVARVARARFATGDEAGARALVAGAEVSPATHAFLEIERARLLFEDDRLAVALGVLVGPSGDPARPRWPEHASAWLLLARTHARLGDTRAAGAAARVYLEREPRSRDAPVALHLAAREALARGKVEEAHALFEEARTLRTWHELLLARRVQARLAPDDPRPAIGLALLWAEAGDTERARRRLEELLARLPDTAVAWVHLADVERLAGDHARALAAVERALALDAELAPAHLARARVLLAQGELTAAEAAHARYLELGGTEPLER